MIKKVNFILLFNSILNKTANKEFLFYVIIISILCITANDPKSFFVNALDTNNCVDNLSVQSQTTINGKTTMSTNNNGCDDVSSTDGILSGNHLLKGPIIGAEYSLKSNAMLNSVFGNWSLFTKNGNIKDFKSFFTLQPMYSASIEKDAARISPNLNQKTGFFNITSYRLSNFISNSIQQQDSEITYVGKIDVIQNIHSNDIKQPDKTNIFKGTDVSIYILNDRIIIINFDGKTTLYNILKNVPLVGLITSK